MPPKPKAGKGGGKLSKADKEKLKKEEAERKAQEEEELRLQAEKEEQEREEKERIEREERIKFEEQERVRQQVEIEELYEIVAFNQEKLAALTQKNRIQQKWDRYMLCDGRPDPTSKKEVNTFINLTMEDESLLDVGKVLKKSELILELIEELQAQIEELQEEEEIDEGKVTEYKESIADLQELIFYKIDQSTFEVLRCPGQKVDPDTLNIQDISKSKCITSCLWGNSAKNPRVKSIDFEKQDFSMELPKQMAMANLALRVLFTTFDQFSGQSFTGLLKKKKSLIPEQESEIIAQDENAALEGSEEGLDSLDVDKPPSPTLSTKTGASFKGSRTSLNSRMNSTAPKDEANKGDDTGVEGSVENIEEVVQDIQIAVEEDEEPLDVDVVDLRAFRSVGEIMHIELLQLPPQAKKTNGWIMQQVVSPKLKRFPYGKNPSVMRANSGIVSSSIDARKSVQISSNELGSNLNLTLPLSIKIKCPENVLVFEPPQVARWDEGSKNWKLDGIEDFKYDEKTKVVSFKTCNFGQFTLIQDLYLNMPFQSWELYSCAANHCYFVISAAYMEITIEVKEDKCCLCAPEDSKELSHLLKKWMNVDKFIEAIRSSGINVFPQEDGDKYVSVTPKREPLCLALYEQMALSACSFAFAWSKWNNECGEEKCVIQATEWRKETRPTEDDYALYMASERICCKLGMDEYSEEFSPDVAPNTQMHPGLYHMLQDGASEVAITQCKESSFLFTNSITKLLKTSNVLVYS